MFKLEENKNYKITMTRGDDAAFSIEPNYKDGVEYVIGPNDIVIFTVRKPGLSHTGFEVYGDAKGTIRLVSADTAYLDPGYYVYDMVLQTPDGKINTIVNRGTFELVEEVS